MEGNRDGFWYSRFGWAIELGFRVVTNIFGDNFPVADVPPSEPPAPAPRPIVQMRRPHTRRCMQDHDRPGGEQEDRNGHGMFRAERTLHTELAVALRRFVQFGGLVQYVAEVTGVGRNAVVQLNEEGRVGRINDRIRTEHRVLFRELQKCLDNLRRAFDDGENGVMQDFDRVQTDRLDLLNAVDFGGNIVPQARDNLKQLQIDCLDILAECYANANEDDHPAYQEAISEMSSFTFHELFLYGQKGYRKCYHEIERAERV